MATKTMSAVAWGWCFAVSLGKRIGKNVGPISRACLFCQGAHHWVCVCLREYVRACVSADLKYCGLFMIHLEVTLLCIRYQYVHCVCVCVPVCALFPTLFYSCRGRKASH